MCERQDSIQNDNSLTNTENNLIKNFDPYKISEHPHNHYIQAFAETGIIGGLAYICIFMSMGYNLYKKTKYY